ncbi:MAG: hypothetical protein HYR60_19985 [Acidobacteria bacterium]|nr:hypothetical protein [Acidobacteriota bacterium]
MALILSRQPGWWMLPTVGTLARVPASGGAPREIAENVVYADWSPDGAQLAVVRQLGGGQVLEYPLGTRLYQSPGFIGMPKISPRGDLLAFIDSANADWYGTIVVLDTQGRKRMAAPDSAAWGFVWSPDGSEIRFCGAESGLDASIKAIDLAGKLRTILPMAGFHILLDGTSDGRLLVLRDGASAAMYFHRPGAAGADLYWHDLSMLRDLSADGSQILFSEGGASQTTDFMTYLRPTDGSPAVLLGLGLASALSPDGHWAMLSPTGPKAPLLGFPTRAGSTQTLAGGEIRHFAGRWLPDAKRIVFAGSEPGHLLRYYVQDSPSSAPRPISGENIAFDRYMDPIAISPDGKQVAATIEGSGIELLPVDAGKPQPVPGTTGFAPVAWCRDGGILMYHPQQIPAQVLRVDPQTGGQRPWKTILPADRTALGSIGPIRFTPDCQTYAYSATYDPSTLLVVSGAR